MTNRGKWHKAKMYDIVIVSNCICIYCGKRKNDDHCVEIVYDLDEDTKNTDIGADIQYHDKYNYKKLGIGLYWSYPCIEDNNITILEKRNGKRANYRTIFKLVKKIKEGKHK